MGAARDHRRPARDGAEPSAGVSEHDTAKLLLGLLRRTHLSSASDLARVVAEEATAIGAGDVALYLIDYEQAKLVPVDTPGGTTGASLSVTGTMAGRAFSTTTILQAQADPKGSRVWLPLLDGTERLGAMGMTFAESPSEALLRVCERYAHLVAMLVVSKSAYSDVFEMIRRRERMTIASELVQELAPPLVLGTDDLTLAGLLEPAYDNGGDALDYALNGRILHLAVFDAMGHGLAAAGVAAFAISAYRYSRRTGRDLPETYAAMDQAVGNQFPEHRFVTALIAELDVDTGELIWISAGHPPVLLIRGGRHASTLEARPGPPLGVDVGGASPEIARTQLEPGDQLLLYTDGLIEARTAEGNSSESRGSASSSSARRPPASRPPRRCAGSGRRSSAAAALSSATTRRP
jgi:hypothetical protein